MTHALSFNTRLTKIGLLALIALSAFFALTPRAHATGVSPSIIVIEDVVSKVAVKRSFTVSRTDASIDEIIKLNPRGEAAHMITFPDGDVYLFEKGKRNLEVTFTVEPGDIATGTYTAHIRATQTQLDPNIKIKNKRSRQEVQEAAQRSFAGSYNLSGAEVDVEVHVTNKLIEKWEVTDVDLKKSEANTPVSFTVNFNNLGGVSSKPGKVQLKVKQANSRRYAFDQTVPGEKIELVAPYSKKPLSIFTDIALKVGRYYAVITVYDRDDKLVYTSQSVFLEIVPEGTLAQEGKIVSLTLDKKPLEGQQAAFYKPGEVATIRGVFGNTGKIGVRTTFTVDIYKDDTKVQALKSPEAFVPAGKEGEFELTHTFDLEGAYVVKGYFPYGISKTEQQQIALSVGVPPSPLSASLLNIGEVGTVPFAVAGTTLALMGLFFFWFKRKKKTAQPFPTGAMCFLPKNKV